jgi:GT2 family glycosyltransferase
MTLLTTKPDAMPWARPQPSVCVCIPTYRRPHLLALLLKDLSCQSAHIDHVVVVDGEPSSGRVLPVLEQALRLRRWKVDYVPSNHANLSFQRYLAWRMVKEEVLLYIDDDIRIRDPESLARLAQAFAREDTEVAGVSGRIEFGDPARLAGAPAVHDAWQVARRPKPLVVRWFGGGEQVAPGSVTPLGDRKPPADGPDPYVQVEWMPGGCMAYRQAALEKDSFSETLFALDERHWGKGEDTYLSRQATRRGRLYHARHAQVEHPHEDLPVDYPTKAYALGFATAYSRRFLNDTYRIDRAPTLMDRGALLRGYLGRSLLAWGRALRTPALHRWSYAWGFTRGAASGILSPPRAERLVPHADWWADAEQALSRAIELCSSDGNHLE